MECDHCQRDLHPNRAIVVTSGSKEQDGPDGWTLTFCLPCHPVVFSEQDYEAYPELFDEWCEWSDALGAWQTSAKLGEAVRLGTYEVASRIRQNGALMGWPVESRRDGRRIWHRLLGPDEDKETS